MSKNSKKRGRTPNPPILSESVDLVQQAPAEPEIDDGEPATKKAKLGAAVDQNRRYSDSDFGPNADKVLSTKFNRERNTIVDTVLQPKTMYLMGQTTYAMADTLLQRRAIDKLQATFPGLSDGFCALALATTYKNKVAHSKDVVNEKLTPSKKKLKEQSLAKREQKLKAAAAGPSANGMDIDDSEAVVQSTGCVICVMSVQKHDSKPEDLSGGASSSSPLSGPLLGKAVSEADSADDGSFLSQRAQAAKTAAKPKASSSSSASSSNGASSKSTGGSEGKKHSAASSAGKQIETERKLEVQAASKDKDKPKGTAKAQAEALDLSPGQPVQLLNRPLNAAGPKPLVIATAVVVFVDPEHEVSSEDGQLLGSHDCIVTVTDVRERAQLLGLNHLLALTNGPLGVQCRDPKAPKVMFGDPKLKRKPMRWPRSYLQLMV